MKNRELFTLDPVEVNLKNEGVAKIRSLNERDDLDLVYYELKTFVCEGEYQEGLRKILQFYLQNYDNNDQPAFWVSGFYGTGKSHLVKMLSYLWDDFEFPNGDTARTIKPLPQEIQDLFVEIDRKQKIQGRLTIAGTLRDFPSKDIRYSFLQILLNALGLPQQYHHFKFVYWTKAEGIYDSLKSLVEASGKDFRKEVEQMFVSTVLAKSILQLMPELAENEMKLLELFRAQFPIVTAISRDEFVKTIKEEILPLSYGDKIPCTVIILDEVQQFIAKDINLAFDVQLLAEDLCSRFDGKFLLVGTGQNALTDNEILQKLMARFRVPIQLTDTDIQKVIRKTILEKKPTAIPAIESKLETFLGEISRNLAGTDYGFITEDKTTLAADYPILPSTRKIWNKLLQVMDTAGTSGQLRNQLRIVDDSLKSVANLELGSVVPVDFIFDPNQTLLIQSGQLMNETMNLIQQRKAKGGDDALEGRILSAVFLINLLPEDIKGNHLKSNENTIADLLIDNLNENSEAFRTKIKVLLKKLVEDNVLMPINEEYKLQTKIGHEWEQEFIKQCVKINNSGDDQIQEIRKKNILTFFNGKTKTINITQGVSRQVREFELWDKADKPNTENKLNIWIRDGWFENESMVLDGIRAAEDSPLAYVLVKKLRDQDLRAEIIKYRAAELTLNAMGLPTSQEGVEAKKSMETRQSIAKAAIEELIDKIGNEAVVYLAGGNTVEIGTIRDNMEDALRSIADRQFPDFKSKADYPNWGQAFTKASVGNPDALNAIGFTNDITAHPMAVEILRFIGNSQKTGKEIRNQFMKSPFGWNQDAIDTMIFMLKLVQHISTSETNLNRSNIGNASFKKEIHVLSAKDKIAIRKLFQDTGITCTPNQDIFPYSNMFLDKLKNLASQISGDAPLPEPININFLKDIENMEGNERLLDILEQQADLKAKYDDWSKKADTVKIRLPLWDLLTKLSNLASDGEELEQVKKEINAIRENRLLLNEPDMIQPKLNELTDRLKAMLNKLKEQYNNSFDTKMAELQSNPYFNKLTPDQKYAIRAKHQLLAKPEIKSLDANALLYQLQKASLYTWETKIAALPGQFQSALDDAIKLSAPQAISYSLPRKTITSQAEIETYIAELKTELEDILKVSSSIILK